MFFYSHCMISVAFYKIFYYKFDNTTVVSEGQQELMMLKKTSFVLTMYTSCLLVRP